MLRGEGGVIGLSMRLPRRFAPRNDKRDCRVASLLATLIVSDSEHQVSFRAMTNEIAASLRSSQ